MPPSSTPRVDLLVAEIGSTTTSVSGFAGMDGRSVPGGPRLVGRGMAPTTVPDGDVTIGLERALDELVAAVGLPGGREALRGTPMLASSSAAGGLRMSVHGLVYDMTVRAAREAALGAGAVLRMVTAGPLSQADLRQLEELRPSVILLAGGVDYGETETALANAGLIAGLRLKGTPIVYAGNVAAREEISAGLGAAGMRVFCVDNVYPRIDQLNVEPARRVIQDVFEEHIVQAPGMERIREMVSGRILPTPGAVMISAQLLYEEIGDLVVLDVGGATTDVHSVTEGAEEIARLMISPEPLAKRTVEGDLGVFLNAQRARRLFRAGELEARVGLAPEEIDRLLDGLSPVPEAHAEQQLVVELTRAAVRTAVVRHAGRIRYLYGPGGRRTVAEGKDLTMVRWIVGTGGALTQLPGGEETLAGLRAEHRGQELLPPPEARVLLDRDYVLAPCGVLAAGHPGAAIALMLRSLGLGEEEIEPEV
jgi:uncharacterized protein (TIGR01319 family)